MRFHSLLSLSLLLSLHVLAQARPPPTTKIRGMAFTSGHFPWQYGQQFATRSLLNLKKTGTRYVHVTVILGVDNLQSLTSYTVTPDSATRLIIRKLRSLGFRVFLKPIVQTRNFEWRGYIRGSSAWFDRVYNPYITRMARISQEEGVDIFSVGSELKATLGLTKEWQKTIALVRKEYKRGWITYVANHDSYKRVKFWRNLDFISISAYFKLLETVDQSNLPDLKRTKRLWKQKALEVYRWRANQKLWAKKILIAEAGAMSKGNGIVYTQPWDYNAGASTDLTVQAWVYEAIFEAFMRQRWCLGIVLYDWEARPNAGKTMPSLQGYTPQNKPAEKVMTKYFKMKY